MVKDWWSGLAAAVVTGVTVALVVLDVTDDALRAWWVDHALTTATVTGLLVLLITVLVVDQVIERRRARDRSRAVATQAAIVLGQAARAAKAVAAATGGSDRGSYSRFGSRFDAGSGTGSGSGSGTESGSGDEVREEDRDEARSELRNFGYMLLIAAPSLIDDPHARTVLEAAQRLGGEMTRLMAAPHVGGPAGSHARFDAAVEQLRVVSGPLLAALRPEEQAAAVGDASQP